MEKTLMDVSKLLLNRKTIILLSVIIIIITLTMFFIKENSNKLYVKNIGISLCSSDINLEQDSAKELIQYLQVEISSDYKVSQDILLKFIQDSDILKINCEGTYVFYRDKYNIKQSDKIRIIIMYVKTKMPSEIYIYSNKNRELTLFNPSINDSSLIKYKDTININHKN